MLIKNLYQGSKFKRMTPYKQRTDRML